MRGDRPARIDAEERPPGLRVVLDARPLQDPGRAPSTARYLEGLLGAYDANPVPGESFAFLLQSDLADPTTAFARYEEIRRERTATVVRKAHENRRSAFSPALANPGAVAAEVAREWQQERVRERMEWLYAHDATAVVV